MSLHNLADVATSHTKNFQKLFNRDLVAQPLYLCVFAEHFGVEADPVVGDKHATLVEDVFLQSTGVT